MTRACDGTGVKKFSKKGPSDLAGKGEGEIGVQNNPYGLSQKTREDNVYEPIV